MTFIIPVITKVCHYIIFPNFFQFFLNSYFPFLYIASLLQFFNFLCFFILIDYDLQKFSPSVSNF